MSTQELDQEIARTRAEWENTTLRGTRTRDEVEIERGEQAAKLRELNRLRQQAAQAEYASDPGIAEARRALYDAEERGSALFNEAAKIHRRRNEILNSRGRMLFYGKAEETRALTKELSALTKAIDEINAALSFWHGSEEQRLRTAIEDAERRARERLGL